MRRRRARGVLVPAMGLVVSSCHGWLDVPAPEGSVDIAFLNTTTLHLSRIDYVVSGNAIEPVVGFISLVDDAATPSAIIGGLPPGSDYLLHLEASADDGAGACAGEASFDVAAGRSSPVAITLVCHTGSPVRTIVVNGYTDYCPTLASYAVSPRSAPVGGTITVSATAFTYYSDPVMFGWRTTDGALSSENTAVATYTCTVAGVHTLTVFVTDGNCPDIATIDVTCVESADAGPEVAARLSQPPA
jgi:hypothetical protein